MMKNDNAPLLPMPIKAKPYAHQVAAFNFVCELFGLILAEDASKHQRKALTSKHYEHTHTQAENNKTNSLEERKSGDENEYFQK